ncbi:MAG: cation diffusion facilitator family transporter [Oscillospiraceae bacterium]|nr:cation diffusion facilitator family transporter [Oscillospiraceae bacterium]
MNKLNRESAQVLLGVLSVVANAVLFLLKLWAGIVTGSIALMADAWHTMSDSASSIFVVIAAKLASKKSDKEHPFGHGRWELIASIFIAVLLAFIGYEFLVSSIGRLRNPDEYEAILGRLAITIAAVSIIVKEGLAQLGFYYGKKFKNPVLIADGWHSRTDSLSSVVILIGVIVKQFVDGLWWMDGVLGILCAIAIFYAAFHIMKEVIEKFLGEAPTEEFITELKSEAIELFGKCIDIHHVHLHNYVTHKELTFHISLDGNMTINESHDMADILEEMVEKKFSMVATIHVEPIKNVR